MEEPTSQKGSDPAIAELVACLNAMRDKLAETKLLLQDFQFEQDSVLRRMVAEHADTLIKQAKTLSE
jgi:hypothetical protein